MLRVATEVAPKANQASFAKATTRPVAVKGNPDITAWNHGGKPLGMMMYTVIDGRIVDITAVIDPTRPAKLDLP